MARWMTVELLREYAACDHGMDEFIEVFPDGKAKFEATEEMAYKIKNLQIEWAAQEMLPYSSVETYEKERAESYKQYRLESASALRDYHMELITREEWRAKVDKMRNDHRVRATMIFLKLFDQDGPGIPVEGDETEPIMTAAYLDIPE